METTKNALKAYLSFDAKSFGLTAMFLALSILLPSILAHTPNNQWITGTVINALLFLSAWQLPTINASLISFFPSTIALTRGLLPAPMAAMIPFIILGNFALQFCAKKIKQPFTAVFVGSTLKFFILFAASLAAIHAAPQPIKSMFGIVQLATALTGGVLALVVKKTLLAK